MALGLASAGASALSAPRLLTAAATVVALGVVSVIPALDGAASATAAASSADALVLDGVASTTVPVTLDGVDYVIAPIEGTGDLALWRIDGADVRRVVDLTGRAFPEDLRAAGGRL